jgi:hypothetical protein
MIQNSSKFNFLGFSNSLLAKKYIRFQTLTTYANYYTDTERDSKYYFVIVKQGQ